MAPCIVNNVSLLAFVDIFDRSTCPAVNLRGLYRKGSVMPTSTGGTESSSFESRDIGFSNGSRAKGSLQEVGRVPFRCKEIFS